MTTVTASGTGPEALALRAAPARDYGSTASSTGNEFKFLRAPVLRLSLRLHSLALPVPVAVAAQPESEPASASKPQAASDSDALVEPESPAGPLRR